MRKQKTCKKCHTPGHNSATCGKQKIIKEPSFKRQCGKCNGWGHNSRTCQGITTSSQNQQPPNQRKTLTEIGRDILNQPPAPRVPIDGTKPQRGLWLVNNKDKKVAGVISYIRKSGQIVWKNFAGIFVESKQETIINAGYKYQEDKPLGLDWKYLNLEWNNNSYMPEAEMIPEEQI